MTENQKLREALELCRAALDNPGLAATLRKYAIRTADEALATTEPAVNQQLTTEPIDERAARATLPTQRSSMDGLPKPFGYVSDGFADGLRFQHNPWPVEHTLLHSTLPVFSAAAVQQFKEDAKRYRWLADSNNYYEAINLISDGSLTEDALGKAIDAAMAKGVKG